MATQTTAWRADDGKLYESAEAAHRASSSVRCDTLTGEAVAAIDRLTSDITDAALDGDSSFGSVKDNLLLPRNQDLILELAAAITALRSLEETT